MLRSCQSVFRLTLRSEMFGGGKIPRKAWGAESPCTLTKVLGVVAPIQLGREEITSIGNPKARCILGQLPHELEWSTSRSPALRAHGC